MSKIEIKPEQLREFAQAMRRINNENISNIKTNLNTRSTVNDGLINGEETRKRALYNHIFGRVDEAGLSALIASFPASYNRTLNTPSLDRVIDGADPIPASMTDSRFLPKLPGETRETTRWYLGGTRWGIAGGTRAVRNRYNDVKNDVEKVRTAMRRHKERLEGEAVPYEEARYGATTTEFASNAFISILNYVSDYAVEVFDGIGGREGQSDGIVTSTTNVLDGLERNLGIVQEKCEELAAQGEAFAADREAWDRDLSYQMFSGDVAMQHTHVSQLLKSQVELAIYRPELLSDGRGLERARDEQRERRYSTLEWNLRTLHPVADFIARPTTYGGEDISSLCLEALNTIRQWENFIDREVTVSVHTDTGDTRLSRPSQSSSTGARAEEVPIMRWERQGGQGDLRDFLEDAARDIDIVKSVLTGLQETFDNTMRLAMRFADAIGRGDHAHDLRERVENAIYTTTLFGNLQSFADVTEQELRRQADVYRRFADQIADSMSGDTVDGYTHALHRGASYCQAIAATIQIYFKRGGTGSERLRTNAFQPRNFTTSGWASKEFDEMLEILGFCPVTGFLLEPNWDELEYLLNLSYHSMTPEMLLALSMVLNQLELTGDEFCEFTRFLRYLANEVVPNGLPFGFGDYTEWEICPLILDHLINNIDDIGEMARLNEQHLSGMTRVERTEFMESHRDVIAAQYFATYGVENNCNVSLWNFLIRSQRQQQENSFDRSAILEAVIAIDGNILGGRGATGPNINITKNTPPEDSHLRGNGFTVSVDRVDLNIVDGNSIPRSSRHDITISAIIPPDHMPGSARTRGEKEIADALSFCPAGDFSRGVGMVGVGFVPFVGPAVNAVDVVGSTVTGVRRERETLAAIGNHLENRDNASLAREIELNGRWIECSDRTHIMLRATTDTEGRLAARNREFPDSPDLTLDDVRRDTERAVDILLQDITR